MKLIYHLPPMLRAVREYAALCDTVECELSALRRGIESVRRELVISTAEDLGLCAWERILSLMSEGSLSDRRAAILSRVGTSAPYTEARIRERLTSLTGEHGYTLECEGMRVSVTVSLEAKGAYDAVCEMLREMLPANVVLTVELKLTRNAELSALSYAALSEFTHDMIRNEVATNESNNQL